MSKIRFNFAGLKKDTPEFYAAEMEYLTEHVKNIDLKIKELQRDRDEHDDADAGRKPYAKEAETQLFNDQIEDLKSAKRRYKQQISDAESKLINRVDGKASKRR